MRYFTWLFFLIHLVSSVSAQPVNDDCSRAVVIDNITDWCSASEAFTNSGATSSDLPKPVCFNAVGNDVWFTFTSISTSINIRVIGDIVDNYGETAFSQGTLREPRMALYQGDCTDFELVECNQDNGDHIAEMYSDQLVPNVRYYIRVSSSTINRGTFQLCVSSFNFIPRPNSDCSTGVVLCDKSSFFVDALDGTGIDANEVEESCVQEEFASAWYKWVAGNNGRLTFVITPNNPGDDLDWALYELPNGLSDCKDKKLLRCNSSGANGLSDSPNNFDVFPIDTIYPHGWRDCTGPTGLREGEIDRVENPGCHATGIIDNNFVTPIDQEEGKVYALIINNYSNTGHGFSLSFGGSGEFLGPEADFTTDDLDGTICFGDPIRYFDASSFGDLNLVDWQWNFGEAALPQTGLGPGPHQIEYGTSGVKAIALAVESETGCLTTTFGQIIVEQPFVVEPTINHVSCPGQSDGRIDLNIISGSTISSITWNNGMTGEGISGLLSGEYEAHIMNMNGCDTFVTFVVESPQPLDINSIVTRPSCNNQQDGSISIDVDGQAPPFLFDWHLGQGFSTMNVLERIPAGIYRLTIRDNNGCETDTTMVLNEFDALTGPNDPIAEPTCFGFQDGRIDLDISGGTWPYQFDWDQNSTFDDFVPDSFLADIGAGHYSVGIIDAALCRSFLFFEVGQPPELTVELDTLNISCIGKSDGTLTPKVSGGSGSYTFSWNHGIHDSLAAHLGPGNYTLSVTDAHGCLTTRSGLIMEPPELIISIDSILDVVCFGDLSGSIFLNGQGGTPPYEFSLNAVDYGVDPRFEQLGAEVYSLFIRDQRGCVEEISAEIFQPEPLMVDAGLDTTIDLGFSTQLAATHTPPLKPVDYQWNFTDLLACDTCRATLARPVLTTTFTVTITDEGLCTAQDQVTITVEANRPVYIPNSFTPNGDGLNDRVGVFAGPAGRLVRKIQIFDRWGELVYEGGGLPLNNDGLGWDGTFQGKILNPGVFVYVVEVEFIDDSVIQFKGDITLIR